MRIAYVCADAGVPWGGTKGASVHVAEMVAALATEGAQVLVLPAALAPGAPEPPSGVEVELLPGPGKGASAAERVRSDSERARLLRERLERFGSEAVYERLALHSAAGSLAARALGVPHIVELNAPLPAEAAAYRHLDEPGHAARLERQALAGADLVLAVSRPLAGYAEDRGSRRVEVFPNAVTPGRYHPRGHDGGAREPVAVLLGSLRPWHGAHTVADAWHRLGATAPPLLVVGDGAGRASLERAGADMLGRRPHEEVPAILARADIGLAPYAEDAPGYFSPLKLFEYLAAGLAVVAADVPGVREVVDGETAVLVPPGDPAGLAGAVAGLARDPERREALGRAGRELVEAHHRWDQRARQVLEAVRRLAEPAVSG
jgi:glycosyltransferase involved in cell wall biosynthesis